MTPADALRFVGHEARLCHDRDAHEALCLLLPAILKAVELPPMDDYEALDFRVELHKALLLVARNPPVASRAAEAVEQRQNSVRVSK